MSEAHFELKQKQLKATSLVEVLIVLAIISTTVISIMLLVARSLESIKRDEIADDANGSLIKALEVIKSPSVIKVYPGDLLYLSLGSSQSSFSLKTEAGSAYIKRQDTPLDLSNCTSNSEYYLQRDSTDSFHCLELAITPLDDPSGVNYYQVDAKVVYRSFGEFKYNTLRAYRYGEFAE